MDTKWLLWSAIFIVISMAEVQNADAAKPADQGSVHIVYMERTGDAPEALEASHIQTLASVLGSEEAAKNAILYSYKHTVNGFSAKLTPEQVDALSRVDGGGNLGTPVKNSRNESKSLQLPEKPGVIQVVPSKTYQLHKGTGVSSSTGLA